MKTDTETFWEKFVDNAPPEVFIIFGVPFIFFIMLATIVGIGNLVSNNHELELIEQYQVCIKTVASSESQDTAYNICDRILPSDR